jgi:hypothetical protein
MEASDAEASLLEKLNKMRNGLHERPSRRCSSTRAQATAPPEKASAISQESAGQKSYRLPNTAKEF